jgi:hypothetical protein
MAILIKMMKECIKFHKMLKNTNLFFSESIKMIREWSIKRNFTSNTMVFLWVIKIVPMYYVFTTQAITN